MAERLLVIGGDAAGMSGASQARRRRGPGELEIVAIERGHFTSYAACGIPYWISGTVDGPDRLISRRPEVFRERFGIDVHLRTEAVDIDPHQRTVRVRDLEAGTDREEPYDQLLIATGARPVRPDLPGINAKGIHGVQTLDDGRVILETLEQRKPASAVVVGGGYIGLEMAEAMVQRGLRVHLVEAAPQPMGTLDPDMGALVSDALDGIGIGLHLDNPVKAFEVDSEGWVRAVQTADVDLPADVVFLGLGNRPSSDLARAAGIPIGVTGGIVIDQRQRTPIEGIWAAGDCTETFHRVSRAPVSIALGTVANKMGRVAGINLGGGYATFPGVVGTAVTRVCGAEVARTGLNERQAHDAGFGIVTATVESTTRAGYFPGAKRMTMKLVAERFSGRLLGAQIVGEEGAAKRIDVFATALWNEMTVDELLNVDLSYAPPFAPVWDPVLIAARKAWQAVDDDRRSQG